MKNKFQSKAVPRGTRTIWRYLGALFLLFTFGFGQMWGDTFSADEIAAKSGSVNVGTTKNHVTISLPGITATSNVKYAKISGTQLKRDMVEVSGKATGGSITTDKVLSIKVDRGYKLLSPIKINGSSSSTSDIKMAYVGWQGQPEVSFQLCNGATDWKFDKNSVTSEPTDREIAFATTIRTIYLYTQIKTANTDYNSFGTSKTVGSGTKAYVYTVDASATLAPEIEGESQMWNDETIALTGYPTGGTWAVVSGPGAIAADGKLTANGNGTIRVSYTVDAVSETKDIIAGTTKQYTWLFNTKDVMPTTLDVTPVKNDAATFESAGQIKLGTNGDYLYIDLSSKNLIVTAASINAKTGSENKHISFGSSKSATEDGNVSATNVYADVNITPTKPSMVFTVIKNAETSAYVASITLTVKKAVPHTLSYAISPDHDPAYATVTLGATSLIEGATTTATYSAIDAAYEFDEWQISGTGATLSDASGDHVTVTMGSTDATVTLKLKAAVTKYTITYSKGEYGTGDAIPDGTKDDGVDFTLSSSTYSRDGYVQTGWSETDGGAKAYDLGGTYSTDADEELFPFWTPVYTVTKGTHENGDFTISPASLVAGGTVTLDPTPNDGYMFSAWEIVKTSDASATGITVTNKQFEMPAYDVTVNATFVADTRKKVLYLTTASTENDKLYAALKDDYKLTVAAPGSQTLTDYDLIVLHESISGSVAGSDGPVKDAATTSVPVLNTKTYFYNSGRWNWGTPNNGQAAQKVATLNSEYCNIEDHPIFSGVTISAGEVTVLTNDATGNTMQPVAPSSGKEGYLLATTPNASSGVGYAIQEIPAGGFRGASSGKYILISVSNAGLNNLTADGQKLFQNAAAYLVDGSASWAPISVPTAAEVTATPSENYTEGNTITLTASATGTTASTTYTWYKGADWATASATTPVQAAATDGNVFTKTAALEDAGTYWCNISNGTSCDVQASVTITVSSASTPTHAISYDNTKGADMTAYPTEYTEGVGVASFAALADIAGWHFVEWSPASIAADATTDQTITAVWAQVFEVTFDLQGHGAAIAAQNIVSGGKVTKPDDPIAIGWDFGGWFTDADCTAGNEWDFDNDVVSAATPLFAKWTEFDGCALLVPATSGAAPAVGDAIVMQTGSKGATMTALAIPDGGSLAYTANGLAFNKKSGVKTNVVLNNDMKVGTKISLKLVAGGDKTRGLFLYTKTGTKIEAFTCWVEGVNPAVENEEETFTYTVVADDGLEGTNEFQLWRNNTVYLKQLAVTECGAAVVYHNLTSAVDPAGKGTVTLDASSVREGLTTKATYSDIDPLYEFVNWTVSGAGASVENATANPATITVGTEDAVVTLNLRLIPVKFTVEYYDGATLMGSEQVAVNENPTASEIVTAKRHYTFLGWSDTDGGDVVALNTITRTEAGTVKLYAKYEAVVCPTSGTIFSMESDEAKKPGETVTIAKDASIDLAEYATISGGNAMIINGETSGKDAISTDGEFLLKATKEVMKVELNCVLQEGDIIRIPDNSAKLVISTSNAKTGTYQAFAAKNTHEFAVTAAWAGVDDIYVLYDGSSLKFTKVYVIRPAKFDVSFNMMGHGSAIADLENVIDGSKITAPTAPTDENYSFSAWYKENELENEWDFDNDVVTANTTLFAKWLDKSDATLKSLKYGDTEIALEDGVYTYNVNVSALVSGVPALTAVTSNPSATKVIANADAFDGEGKATSTVEVTPEKEGAAHQTYTVKFTKLPLYTDIVDVTGYTEWSWAGVATAEVKINDVANRGVILANYIDAPHFEMLAGQENARAYRNNTYPAYQGTYLKFHATVPGRLTIKARNSSGSPILRVNGIDLATLNGTPKDYITAVPEGDVEITSSADEFRIYAMTFDPAVDYTRDVTEGKYGTICLPTNGVMIGTTIYTLAFYGATSQKIFFDEVVTGRMEAGKPYLFLPEQGVTELKVFYTDSETKAAQTVNGFHGYIGDSEDPEDALPVPAGEGNYIVQNNTYREVQTGATAYILSHRAYINFSGITTTEPAKAPGARRIGLGKDAAQGFENIESGDQPMKVMIGGTLYIIRGEKVYNANGQVVK